MEILSEHSVFSRESREEQGESNRDLSSLFLWSVVIVALMGLNAFSWIFCMYVFGNPEVPFNYKLLTKLEKMEPIKGFLPVTAPRGKFFTAKQLHGETYRDDGEPIAADELNVRNNILKRYYLYNYKEIDDVTFISGTFQVLSVRRLEPEDVFPNGLAIRARAIDFPAGYIDLILPALVVPAAHYRPGDQIELEESASCFAVLHVQRLDESGVCFTAVPLVARDFTTPAGSILTVAPPEQLNLDTGRWPLSDEPVLRATPTAPVSGEEPAADTGGGETDGK
jgi:hypothetical protein